MAAPEERVRRARRNLRRHMLRAAARVTTLLIADALALILLRAAAEWMATDGALIHFSLAGAGVQLVTGASWVQLYLSLVFALAVAGCYRAHHHWWQSWPIIKGAVLACVVQQWGEPAGPGLLGAVVLVPVLAATLMAMRGALHLAVARLRPFREPGTRAVLVGPLADCIAAWGGRALSDPASFSVVGIVTTDQQDAEASLGNVEELHRILHHEDVDTVILCGDAVEGENFTRVAQSVLAAECRILALPPSFDAASVRPALVKQGRRLFIELRAPVARWQQLLLKRAFDIVAALVLIVVLAPVLVAIAILVRLDTPGPILFGHSRYGHAGRRFKMLKFRSMRPDAEEMLQDDPELYEKFLANDCKLPEHEDPRLTRIGRFLRKTSLDELPQLFNVLKGDMSLVGPRPVVETELRFYDNWLLTVQSVRPGMTGWWQVNGRSAVTWPKRAELDIFYAVHWSFSLDLRILAKTAPAVISQRGAF